MKTHFYILLTFIFLSNTLLINAQNFECSISDGSDGALIVSSSNTIINDYAHLLANETIGETIIEVNDGSAFFVDDKILIIQMQNTAGGTTGIHEIASISSISSNELTLTAAISNTYYSGTFDEANATNAQVVRIPEYTTVTVDASGSITAKSWDGYSGGILVFNALTSVTNNGSIDVSGKGYRGGGDSKQGESYTGKGAFLYTVNAGGGAIGSQTSYAAGGNGAHGGGGGAHKENGMDGELSTGSPVSNPEGGIAYSDNCGSILTFGSGGGSGGVDSYSQPYPVGGNGGGIILVSSPSITNNGIISGRGDNGSNGSSGLRGGAGGGAGGYISIFSNSVAITTDVGGGTGGAESCCGRGAGGNGAIGYSISSLINYSLVSSDLPTVTTNDEIVSSGLPIILSIESGDLNDAAKWHAYTSSCGITSAGCSIGSGNTIIVTPGDGVTTYYVRGDGACAEPGLCGSVTVYAEGTLTTTYTGGVWDNGIPNAAYHVIIDDNFTATTDFNAYTLRVNSAYIMDLDGNNLNVKSDLTLESGAALIDDGLSTTIGGTQSLERYINADDLTDFHLMSVPISNGDYEDSFQGSYVYRYIGAEYNNIYAFDNGEKMVVGEGVAISGNNISATTRVYTGNLNKGPVNYTLISSDQWHLLGNPYPAPLSLQTFYNENSTTIRPTFYFYNESTGVYDTWNTSLMSGTGSATANVGVAQGFFVEELTSTAAEVSYTADMRINASNVFLRIAQEDMGLLNLQLNEAETLIAWDTDFSNEEDINDANYLQGSAACDIYTLLNNKPRSIQAINNEFHSTIIPLGFYTLEGGENTISILNLHTDEYIEVILIDKYENTSCDLKTGEYKFLTEISNEMIDDRFELVLVKVTLSANENKAFQPDVIVTGGDELNVISENQLSSVRVYDITGTLVHETKNIHSNYFRYSGGKASAIYLIEVVTKKMTSNHKIILK